MRKVKRGKIQSSDVVKDPKPRNPRGTTSTFKSPTRTRPRKLIPEQNPKPDIQTPKPRKSPKVLNLYIKYLKNTIKINNKSLEKFFFKIYYIFFFPSTFKSQKNNANIFVELFFKKKNHKKSLLIKNFGDILTKIWKPETPIPRGENTRTRKNPKSKTRPRPRPRNVYPEPAPTFAPRLHH